MKISEILKNKSTISFEVFPPKNKEGKWKALCNGCFVDNNYVYLAYGSYGIVVIDKNTHKVIAHRAVEKSANYITVHDGYIYVAYGRSRGSLQRWLQK
jgi:5,10-methylenetetrahydrofolate reductase